MSRVFVNTETDVLRPQNMSKSSKIIGVIAMSCEYRSEILLKDVNIRPLLVLIRGKKCKQQLSLNQ